MRAFSMVIVGVVAILGCAATWAEEPSLKSVDERVAVLERTVVRDPFTPKATVLARLDALEKRLDAADSAGTTEQKVEARQDEQIQRTVDALARQVKELDARLDRAEKSEAGADQLREIKATLGQLTRSVAEMGERVRRMEAKK